MNAVTILWAGVGGAALTMAVGHGSLWLLDRRGIANLVLAIVVLAVAGMLKAGLGIGLALSRAIIQAHGGELQAENNRGDGATLRFTLAAS